MTGSHNRACLAEACDASEGGTPGSKFAGGHRIRVTPVPIPNTEVKPDTADGTAWETVWESRSLPALFRARCEKSQRVFYVRRQHSDRAQFPMRMGSSSGRLAGSAAVWESRSLPALFTKARDAVSRALLFSGPATSRRSSFPCGPSARSRPASRIAASCTKSHCMGNGMGE